MKNYLLMAGDTYSVSRGTSSWKRTYETFEEAERSVSWNLSGSGGTWEGNQYDWIEIVNLESWTSPL